MKSSFVLKILSTCWLIGLPLMTWSQTENPTPFDQTTPTPEPTIYNYVTPVGEPGPTDYVELEQQPAILNLEEMKPIIGYPRLAKESIIQGRVVIRVLVSEEGRYLKHVVLTSPHQTLTEGVTSKADQFRFSPGILGGTPVKAWLTIPFEFTLLGLAPPCPSVGTVGTSLEDALAKPDPGLVTEINLAGRQLESFPPDILRFTNLEKLELGDNRITKIPAEIQSLTHLQYIGLSNNLLTSLPSTVWKMPSLEALNLQNNRFTTRYREMLEKKYEGRIFPKAENQRVVWFKNRS